MIESRFWDTAGPMALGSRLRAVAAQVTEDAEGIYADYGVQLDPRWFPTFLVLSRGPQNTVTDIAEAIGQTHAAVSQVAKAMKSAGLVESRPSPSDGRSRELHLSPAGRALALSLEPQIRDVGRAVEALLSEIEPNLWAALEQTTSALARKDLRTRVAEVRKARIEARAPRVRDYQDADQPAFEALNLQWIQTHFEVEEKDRLTLENPRSSVLEPGGAILLAERDGRVVGTVALMRTQDPACLELVKMAVDPAARGGGIGIALGRAAVARARELGAKRLYLESHPRLAPAVALYRKLGFETVEGRPTPYARCGIQMEMVL